MSSELQAIRAEAKELGVKWAHVLAAYDQVKAEEAAAREHVNDVRQQAWTTYTADRPYAWEFWRIGFATRFGRIVAAADYKRIPGYDVLHQEIARRFPEFADDDGCERLWTFLLSPYRPMPRRVVMLRTALERAAEEVRRDRRRRVKELEAVPF
jgi:hypothetical protein